jgi:hypothetical protein
VFVSWGHIGLCRDGSNGMFADLMAWNFHVLLLLRIIIHARAAHGHTNIAWGGVFFPIKQRSAEEGCGFDDASPATARTANPPLPASHVAL